MVRHTNKAVSIGQRLDVQSVHPNVSTHVPTKDSKIAALTYPLKEDEQGYKSFGDDVDLEEVITDSRSGGRGGGGGGNQGAWSDALAATSYDAAMEILREKEPKDYVTRHRDISSFFKTYFAPKFKPTYGLDDFLLAPIDWDSVPKRNSVVIVGPPNLGKTQYALAQLGECPLFVTHIDHVARFDPTVHTGILFDEVSFKKFPPSSFVSVLDRELPRQIHCRYKVAEIPADVKKIICTNDLENVIPEAATDDTLAAIEDRMTIYRITQKTY